MKTAQKKLRLNKQVLARLSTADCRHVVAGVTAGVSLCHICITRTETPSCRCD